MAKSQDDKHTQANKTLKQAQIKANTSKTEPTATQKRQKQASTSKSKDKRNHTQAIMLTVRL